MWGEDVMREGTGLGEEVHQQEEDEEMKGVE